MLKTQYFERIRRLPHIRARLVYYIIISIAGSIYYLTLLPGVGYTGDTAKFQFVGYILGTPHTSGYPLYVLLNYLFTHIFPWGEIAFRANLLSAIFAIGTLIVLYEMLRLLGVNKFVSCLSVFSFAFTSTFWSQSIVAEVYSLHALLVSLSLLYFLKWENHPTQSTLLTGFAIYALSFGNHLMMVTLLPGLVYLLFKRRICLSLDRHGLIAITAVVMIACLQYSYIFWRTYDRNTLYLEMSAPTFSHFIWELTGGQFRGQMFDFGLATILGGRLPKFFGIIASEMLFLLPFILIGIVRTRNKITHQALFIVLLSTIIVCLNYDIPDIKVYLIPAFLILVVFAADGLQAWYCRMGGWLSIVFALLPVAFLLVNFGSVSRAKDVDRAKEVRRILNTVRQDALIIPPSYRYAQYFLYYVFTENLSKKRIYILHPINLRSVMIYISRKRAIYLPPERIYVPPGLNVYCMKPQHKMELRNAGYEITRIDDKLFRIRLVPN